MKAGIGAVLVISAAIAASGCGKKETPKTEQPTGTAATATTATTQPAAPADPAAQAKRVFKTKCVVCHGETGKGDGPGAAALTPKPRNYTDAEWQKTITDDQLKKTIVQGGAAVGKSAGMPGNPDLRGKEEVLNELVKIIRGFAAK